MKRFLLIALAASTAGLLAWASACSTGAEPTPTPSPTPTPAACTEFTFYTPAWKDGDMVPTEYTCDGEGGWGHQRNPELIWCGAPAGTEAFVMIFDDPTFGNPYPHWAFFTDSTGVRNIPDGVSNTDAMPEGVVELIAGDGRRGYIPNCPGGNLNTYRWRLWAVGTSDLGVSRASSFSDLEAAAEANSLGMLEFSGQSDASGF